ncbi:MAG: nucleoside-diphosphate kinase [Chlamydiae bacterium]|nr:nucleoside-diphosphate kinase [Chlamydiota bacterium]
MMQEQTLSIIKPDAVEKNQIGNILARFEKEGLKIVAAKMLHLPEETAKKFYIVHKDRPFYMDLVRFMISGPILVLILEGADAVAKNRKIMGATDLAKAEKGTIRKDFAESIERNAVHGSDSKENAKVEIEFFFTKKEIFSR